MTDLYREEEDAQFRAYLPSLQRLLEVCAQTIGQARETPDYEQARQIVDRVLDTLAELIAKGKPPER